MSAAFWDENNASIDTKATFKLQKFDFTTAQINLEVHIKC